MLIFLTVYLLGRLFFFFASAYKLFSFGPYLLCNALPRAIQGVLAEAL